MTGTLRAGPAPGFAREDANQGTSNVRQLGRQTTGVIAEWIELLARISHDLRTPLNAMIGFSEAMQMELYGPLGHARYQEYASHIRSSGDLLLKAAEETLSVTALLAAPRTLEWSDIRLHGVLDRALEDLADVLTEMEVTCVSSVPEDLDVRSDAHILRRAVRQLLTAALSHAAGGATIAVAAVASHGHVDLIVSVSGAHAPNALRTGQQSKSAPEHGIGRESLSIWMARTLLDIIDCPLSVHWDGKSLELRTSFEQTLQTDFFA